MGNAQTFVMFVAVDEVGRRDRSVPTAVVCRECAHALSGAARRGARAVLEPGAVLEALDGWIPRDREARSEYSAVLKLALVAEARGLVLCCDGTDPTTWTPAQHRDYLDADVQTALGIVAEQLDCTVERAAYRLFAVADEVGACPIATSRDVISGRLSFIGSPV